MQRLRRAVMLNDEGGPSLLAGGVNKTSIMLNCISVLVVDMPVD